jgi:hypothetical protein
MKTPATWYWYIRRDREIFVDLDSKQPDVHAKKLLRCRERLEGSIAAGLLFIEGAWLYPSPSLLHHHLMILSTLPHNTMIANVWALYLGSDIFRALNNVLRDRAAVTMNAQYLARSADLLISDEERITYHRKFDQICHCPAKHKMEVMAECPVAKQLRQEFRARDFFGKPKRNIEPWERLGRVWP